MECLRAELGQDVPTSAPQQLRLHADLKSKEYDADDSHWKRATSPTSETETDDLSRSSLSSFERSSSDETLPPHEHLEPHIELEPASELTHLSKARALALQKELLAAFSSPHFQKCFSELVRGKKRALIEDLVRKQQIELIGKYGFDMSNAGVADMARALKILSDDPDILVNDLAIEEVLAIDRTQYNKQKDEPTQANHNPKPLTYTSVKDLLLGREYLECALVAVLVDVHG